MEEYLSFRPGEINQATMHQHLLAAVAPRPIALASTISASGHINLSPFSFFNVFSSDPPILIFSPALSGADNTAKHTLENVLEVPEVVINIVNYAMVEQMSLSSANYPKSVNEFKKSGLTEKLSSIVSPPMVYEAPVAMECKVNQVVRLGDSRGAGNLIICQVLAMHIKKDVLTENQIDIKKLDHIGRMGQSWYIRAASEALFEIEKPLSIPGIGVDSLPEHIRNSSILTGNDLGKLGNMQSIPSADSIDNMRIKHSARTHPEIHRMIKTHINEGLLDKALSLAFI